MHRYLTIFLSSVVLIATLTSAYANTSRLALVIGNADYQGAPLRNPENDANDMANTLKRLGFEVILAQNADQKTMINAVREFEQRLRNGGIGLFYYSGHGVQHANHNYLVPVGADIESEFDIEFETIDASYVLKHMEQANKNGVNIVILDACRNNPFLRRFRNLRRGLARMDSVRGSLIAYATAPGTTAEDGTGRNGTYTKHLLTALRTIPHMSIADLFIEVTAQVEKETHGQQVPWQSLSLTHRFCFAPCGETVRLTQPETSTPYTRPETSIPNTRPETSIPNTRPETSIPYTRPETSIPYTRPVPSVQYTEPEPPVQYLATSKINITAATTKAITSRSLINVGGIASEELMFDGQRYGPKMLTRPRLKRDYATSKKEEDAWFIKPILLNWFQISEAVGSLMSKIKISAVVQTNVWQVVQTNVWQKSNLCSNTIKLRKRVPVCRL